MSTALWWGRFDPEYSRNRILRQLFGELGWTVIDFRPRLSRFADLEITFRGMQRPDLVWVPCFRQRDLLAASRWAKRKDVPLVFDPLISSYDKQVDEREKFSADSSVAKRLLAREQLIFSRADRVLADTPAHADYFSEVLNVDRNRLDVVYVGAEVGHFSPAPVPETAEGMPCEVLFFGSFIPLQAPQVVVEAARLYTGPPVKWTLLGRGPLLNQCVENARDLSNVAFEGWLSYGELPRRIHKASILLGVFGTTPKAGRVIPNKVFQALACGRVVVTRAADSYPARLLAQKDSGIVWTVAGDAQALADRVAELVLAPNRISKLGEASARTSREFFSEDVLRNQLATVLGEVVA